jgi:hypothetical protein
LRIIFLSYFLSAFSSVNVKVHVSVPYVATCLSNVLYTCSLATLDIISLLSVLRFAKKGQNYIEKLEIGLRPSFDQNCISHNKVNWKKYVSFRGAANTV